MKRHIVQTAILTVLVAGGLLTAVRPATAADMSDRVAVIQIKAIDGLDASAGNIQVNRADQFVVGSRVRVSRSALSSLDGVKTLVLIERRTDSKQGGDLVQDFKGEVLAVKGDAFTVKGADGKDLSYVVDVLADGSVDLVGPGDRIVARSGGLFQIWKIEGATLVSRNRIALY